MALIYVRLPHYVASYLRNFDARHPVPVGQPIAVEQGDLLHVMLTTQLEPNRRHAVNIDCLTEAQWNDMRKGHYICRTDDLRFDLTRRHDAPLTLGEVFTLTGHDKRIRRDPDTMELLPDTEYIDEYVPFLLPRVIVRDGREHRVTNNWYLPDAKCFRHELVSRFKMSIVRFIAADRQRTVALSLPRTKTESLERFMCRYDIRPGDKVREQLGKQIKRSDNFARYSLDNDPDTDDLPECRVPRSTQPRPVICLDDGSIYPSIHAFARAVGTTVNNASMALHNGHRCLGHRIEFYKKK